jgi:hypothetical protein
MKFKETNLYKTLIIENKDILKFKDCEIQHIHSKKINYKWPGKEG